MPSQVEFSGTSSIVLKVGYLISSDSVSKPSLLFSSVDTAFLVLLLWGVPWFLEILESSDSFLLLFPTVFIYSTTHLSANSIGSNFSQMWESFKFFSTPLGRTPGKATVLSFLYD